MINLTQEQIMQNWDNRYDAPLISCCCITYNQRNYIEQCLDGFLIQKTTFPFEIIIHDDCSTDGTTEVIKKYVEKYPKLFVPLYEDENQYSKGVRGIYLNYVFPYVKGQYIALCEGDDYWIDENKLQLQIDWLENNPDYVMCASDAVITNGNSKLDWIRYETDSDISIEEMILGGGLYIQTCTLVYKKSLIDDSYPECCKKCLIGDYPLQIWAALNGKVRYISKKMGLYRFQEGNSWTANFKKNIDKNFPIWKSQIQLLQGLDEYSGFKYHDCFMQKEKNYIYGWIVYEDKSFRSPKNIKYIYNFFKEEKNILSIQQRIKLILFKYDFLGIFRCLLNFRNMMKKKEYAK